MTRAVALDANLLLLYVVGKHSKRSVTKVRRLQTFSSDDFTLLDGRLRFASRLILSPNCVTETSNLLHSGSISPEIQGATAELERLLVRFGECYVPTVNAISHASAIRLGIADCVMLMLAATGALLMTVDADLWSTAQKSGYRAINFNHLRTAYRA